MHAPVYLSALRFVPSMLPLMMLKLEVEKQTLEQTIAADKKEVTTHAKVVVSCCLFEVSISDT